MLTLARADNRPFALEVDSAGANVTSLASLERSSGIGGSQAQALGSAGKTENAPPAISALMAGLSRTPGPIAASDSLQGRKRNVTIAGFDSSPGSIDDAEDNDARDEKRRQPVKRACNECRQQKVGTTHFRPCDTGKQGRSVVRLGECMSLT